MRSLLTPRKIDASPPRGWYEPRQDIRWAGIKSAYPRRHDVRAYGHANLSREIEKERERSLRRRCTVMVARLSSVFKDGRGDHAVEFTTTSTGLYDACDEGRGSGASQPSAVVDLDSVRAQVPHRPLASPPASLLRAQRCRLMRFHELLSTITHASPRDLLRSHFVSVASQIYRVNVCSGIS